MKTSGQTFKTDYMKQHITELCQQKDDYAIASNIEQNPDVARKRKSTVLYRSLLQWIIPSLLPHAVSK